ncbi:MAG: hypothetical protein IPJ84_09980 [Bdellovibrionales bacterium]|nr:hypothetical protein [Bdellovibrionales bacterium]
MSFTERDHDTWRLLYHAQDALRSEQLIPEFASGLKALGILGDKIPDLEAVNARLQSLTGWNGVSVAGFEGPEHFYKMLANREFPVGHFIRDQKDLSYTPEPDVFHDLYGHLPFYVMPEYGKFCEDFGTRGLKYLSSPRSPRPFSDCSGSPPSLDSSKPQKVFEFLAPESHRQTKSVRMRSRESHAFSPLTLKQFATHHFGLISFKKRCLFSIRPNSFTVAWTPSRRRTSSSAAILKSGV